MNLGIIGRRWCKTNNKTLVVKPVNGVGRERWVKFNGLNGLDST